MKMGMKICITCGKENLSKNVIGINMKLLSDKIETFYCMDCLADYLEVTVEDTVKESRERPKVGALEQAIKK